MVKAYRPTKDDLEKVRAMFGVVGLSVNEVAAVMGVSPGTIKKYHREDIKRAHPMAVAQVAGALFKTATTPGAAGHVDAAKFWLKTRGRWTETNVLEVRANIAAGNSPVLADLRKLPTESLRDLEAIAGMLDEQESEDDGDARDVEYEEVDDEGSEYEDDEARESDPGAPEEGPSEPDGSEVAPEALTSREPDAEGTQGGSAGDSA